MKSIEIITVPVKDQQQAKAFYLSIGFQVVAEAPNAHGQTWIQMSLPGQDVSIALLNFHSLIIGTENMEKEIESLNTRGIEVGKVDTQPWGRFAWFKDLDGNGICLHQK